MRPLALLLMMLSPPTSAPPTPAPPTSGPLTSAPGGDAELDFLFQHATPATRPADLPTTRPSTAPASPFAGADDPSARAGVVMLSDGTSVRGRIATTRDKPLRVWDATAKRYRDVPWPLVRSIEARVIWERDEPEWQFRESGSDIKVFTGRTYPARQLEHVVTLVNGQPITGRLAAPLFVQSGDGERRLILHDRDKGPVGQTLRELVYVTRVEME
jgi:hypothetical protein